MKPRCWYWAAAVYLPSCGILWFGPMRWEHVGYGLMILYFAGAMFGPRLILMWTRMRRRAR